MWSAVLMVAIGQLDPASGGTLPGYDPGQWQPPARIVEAAPAGPYEYHRVYDSTDAVAWALLDLKLYQKIDPAGVPFQRYVWIPPQGDVTWIEANSLVVNSAINQSSLIVLPEVISGGWLLRWDLRKLAPKPDDLRRLLIVWDALAIGEPYFHIQLPHVHGVQSVQKSRPYQHIDGKTYHARVFVPAPHVGQGYSLLETETHSFAPLVRADEFLRRISSTIEGGLYYHAIGFIRDGHRLTEAEILRQVGLDVLLSRKVEGDDRAGLFQRGPTGSPGTIEQVQGAVGRARITYDVFAEDVDASRHAIYNVLGITELARGKEIIFERPNGTHGYVLVDGKGKLVDEAPPNLASDHRTPAPHHPRLAPALSCIRCHGPTGGVMPVRNDVGELLKGGPGEIDLLDDFASGKGRFETVDRIAGLYAAGDKFQADLDDSRNKLADAVFRATKGSGPRGPEGVTSKAYGNIAQQFAAYWYAESESVGGINADDACLELGYRVKPGEGKHVLRQVLPTNRVDVLIDGQAIEFTDPAIGALKRGMAIRRQDWTRVFPYAASEAVKARGVK